MPVLSSNSYDSLVSAINDLQAKGYTHDFNQQPDQLECKALGTCYAVDAFTITHVFRFEGMSDPGDNSVLYVIEAKDGTKGMLIDAYGMYADSLSPEMIEKFRIGYQ